MSEDNWKKELYCILEELELAKTKIPFNIALKLSEFLKKYDIIKEYEFEKNNDFLELRQKKIYIRTQEKVK